MLIQIYLCQADRSHAKCILAWYNIFQIAFWPAHIFTELFIFKTEITNGSN